MGLAFFLRIFNFLIQVAKDNLLSGPDNYELELAENYKFLCPIGNCITVATEIWKLAIWKRRF
jgi:hypothetical protein